MAPNLDTYFKEVDSQAEYFIERLRKAVAIPSVSADEARRPDVVKVRMILTFCLVRAMGCTVTLYACFHKLTKSHSLASHKHSYAHTPSNWL